MKQNQSIVRCIFILYYFKLLSYEKNFIKFRCHKVKPCTVELSCCVLIKLRVHTALRASQRLGVHKANWKEGLPMTFSSYPKKIFLPIKFTKKRLWGSFIIRTSKRAQTKKTLTNSENNCHLHSSFHILNLLITAKIESYIVMDFTLLMDQKVYMMSKNP